MELVIDEIKIIREIKKSQAKKVLLQAPEGLKQKLLGLTEKIEKETKAIVIVSCDSCFGACDVPLASIEMLKPDLAIHLGHEEMLEMKKVVFVPVRYEFEENEKRLIMNLVLKYLEKHKIRELCLVASVQYLKLAEWLAEALRKEGIEVFSKNNRYGVKMQVLGCDFSAVDASKEVLLISDGYFHAIGVVRKIGKEIMLLNPAKQSIEFFGTEELKQFEKQKHALFSLFLKAKTIGIIISSKPGQFNEKLAFLAKEAAQKFGKKAFLLACDTIRFEELKNIRADFYISTACPRLFDDAMKQKTLLMNAGDFIELAKKFQANR